MTQGKKKKGNITILRGSCGHINFTHERVEIMIAKEKEGALAGSKHSMGNGDRRGRAGEKIQIRESVEKGRRTEN